MIKIKHFKKPVLTNQNLPFSDYCVCVLESAQVWFDCDFSIG